MSPFEEALVTELCLTKERINELEHGLEQIKSQLVDTFQKDSVVIMAIDNLLNLEK